MKLTIFSLAYEIDVVVNYHQSIDSSKWEWNTSQLPLGHFDTVEEARKALHAVKRYHEEMDLDFDPERYAKPRLVIYRQPYTEYPCLAGGEDKVEEVLLP